jgi:hypothetical protein
MARLFETLAAPVIAMIVKTATMRLCFMASSSTVLDRSEPHRDFSATLETDLLGRGHSWISMCRHKRFLTATIFLLDHKLADNIPYSGLIRVNHGASDGAVIFDCSSQYGGTVID